MDLRNKNQQIIFAVNKEGDTLNVSFGEPATTEELLTEAISTWTPEALTPLYGKNIHVNGAIPVVLGALLAARLKNLAKSLSFYVPREGKYVTLPLP